MLDGVEFVQVVLNWNLWSLGGNGEWGFECAKVFASAESQLEVFVGFRRSFCARVCLAILAVLDIYLMWHLTGEACCENFATINHPPLGRFIAIRGPPAKLARRKVC